MMQFYDSQFFIQWFVTRVTQLVPLLEQELPTLFMRYWWSVCCISPKHWVGFL